MHRPLAQKKLQSPKAVNLLVQTTNPSPPSKKQTATKREIAQLGQNPLSPSNQKVNQVCFPSPLLSFDSDFQDIRSEFKKSSDEKTLSGHYFRSFEDTLTKTKETYEAQLLYMQEYINFLKKKLDSSDISSVKAEDTETRSNDRLIIEDLRAEIQHLQRIIVKKDSEIKNYLDELCEKQDKIYYFSEKIDSYEKIENYEKRLSATQRFKAEMDQEKEIILEKQLRNQYQQRITELESICRNHQSDLLSKTEEISHLRNQIVKYEVDLAESSATILSRKIKERVDVFIGRCELVIAELHSKSENSESKVCRLMKTVRFLQSTNLYPTHNKLQTLEKELTDKYESEIKNRTGEIEEMEQINERITEENTAMKNKIEGLCQHLQELEEGIRGERKDFEALRGKLEGVSLELKSAKAENHALKREKEESEERLERAYQESRAQKKAYEDLGEEIGEVRRSLERAQEEIEADKNIIGQIKGKNAEMQKELERCCEEIKEEKKENKELKTDKLAILKELEYANEENIAGKNENRELKAVNLARQREIENVQEEVIAERNITKELRAINEELQDKLESAYSEINIERETNRELENEIIDLRRDIQIYSEELSSEKHNNREFADKNEGLLKDLGNAYEEIQYERKANSELTAAFREAQENLESASQEIRFEKETHDELKIEHEKLSICLQELEHDIKEKIDQRNDDLANIKTLKEILHQKYEEISEKNKEIESLLVQNQNGDEASKKLIENYNNLLRNNEKKIEFIDELKVNGQEKSKKIEKLTKQNEEMEIEIINFKKSINTMKAEILDLNRLSSEKESRIKILGNEKLDLTASVENLLVKIEESKNKIFDLSKTVQSLKFSIAEKDLSIKELNEMLKNQAQAATELTSFNNSLQKLMKTDKNIIKETQKTLSDSNQKVSSLTQALTSLELQNNRLTEAVENLKSDKNTAKDYYEKQIDLLSNEKEETMQSLILITEAKDIQSKNYQESISELEKDNYKLLNELSVCRREIENLQVSIKNFKLKALESETGLTKVNLNLSEEIKAYKRSENKAKKEAANLNFHNQQLKEQLNGIDANICKISEENSHLRSTIQEIESENLRASENQASIILDLEEKVSGLENIIRTFESEIKAEAENHRKTRFDYEKRLNQKDLAIIDLERKSSDLNSECNIKQSSIQELEKAIIELKSNFSEQSSKKHSELENKSGIIHSQNQTISGYETLYKQLQETHSNLQATLREKELFIEELLGKCQEYTELTNSLKETEMNLLEANQDAKKLIEEKVKIIIELQENSKKAENNRKELVNTIEKEQRLHEENLRDKQEIISGYIKDYEASRKQVEDLHMEIDSIKIKNLENETNMMNSNLEIKDGLKKSKNKEIELTREISGLQKINSELKHKINKFDNDILSITNENNKLYLSIEENENLNRKNVTELEEIISMKEENINTLAQTIEELTIKLENETQQMISVSAQKEAEINSLLAEIDECQRTIENNKQAYSELHLKNKKLDNQIAEIKLHHIEETEMLSGKIKEQNVEFLSLCKSKNSSEILNKKLSEMQDELDEKLNESLAKVSKIQSKSDLLEKEKEDLECEIIELNLTIKKQTIEHNQSESLINCLKSEIDTLNESLLSHKQSFYKLKQDHSSIIRQEKDISNKISAELSQCKFQMDRLQIELNSLKLKSLESETALSKQNLELSEEVLRNQEIAEELKTENYNLQGHSNDLQINLRELSEKLTSMLQDNQFLLEKAEELEGKNKILEREKEILNKKLQELEKRNNELAEVNEGLKQSDMNNELLISDLKYELLVQEKNLIEDKKIEENMEEIIEKDYNKMSHQEGLIEKLETENYQLVNLNSMLEQEIEQIKAKFESILGQRDSEIRELARTTIDFKEQTKYLLRELNLSDDSDNKNTFDLRNKLHYVRGIFEELRHESKELYSNNNELMKQNNSLINEIQLGFEENRNIQLKLEEVMNEKEKVIGQYIEKIKEIEGKNEEFSAAIKEKTSKYKELKQKANELEILVSSLSQNSSKEIEQLKYSEHARKSILSTLEQERSEILEEKNTLEQEFNTITREFDSATERNKMLERKVSELQRTVDNLNNLIEETNGQDIHELQQKVLQMETKLILVEYHHEKDQTEIQRLQENNQQRINLYKIDVLNKDLEDKKTLIETLINEAERSRLEIKKLKDGKERMTDLLDQLNVNENLLAELTRVNVNTGDGRNKVQELIPKAALMIQKVQALRSSL